MNSISWFEAIQATVSSCLPCLSKGASSNDDDGAGNRPPGHLRSLLAQNSSNTSLGDETLSLHSTSGRIRKKNKKNRKSITLFGFDLFGKRPPPIHLSDDEDDSLVRPRQRRSTSSASTDSSGPYTFDSDAAPLDSALINRFTAEEVASRVREAQAAEETERLAKEERRRKRRERKELKRLAGTLAANPDGEFEGFQGSGGGVPYKAIPSPLLKLANGEGSSVDGSQSSRNDHPRATADPEDVDEADLDGIVYARGTRAGSANGSHSGGRSNSNSDSRTTSSLNPIPYPVAGEILLAPAPAKKTKAKRSKRSQSSSNTRSSGSTQSPSSIGSPIANSFQAPGSKVDPTFEGVDFGDMIPQPHIQDFPSTGLGVRRNSSANSGAFLARTSDD